MKRLMIVLATALSLTGCTTDGSEKESGSAWSYTSGDGKTYTADAVPQRIIAHAHSAAALMEYGIKPVGVWADRPIEEDSGLQNVDLGDITVLGEEWGKIDVEKAATLRPDLIVGDWWPVEKKYSGMEDGVEKSSAKIGELATVVGPSQGDSIVELIEGYEELARSLGADIDGGPGARAKTRFIEARDRFKAAVKAKPGLTALAISPADDKYYLAVPEHAPELLDFRTWGLDVIIPRKPDPEFPYWQTLSFENADQYQADMLLFDDRNHPSGLDLLKEQPIARSIRALSSKQYTTWPAYWLHTWSDYAEQLDQLTNAVKKADPDLVTEKS